MDIIRGRSARRRPHSSSRGVRPSTGARRSWARDAGGVARPDGTVRRRPSTAPTGGRGRHALVRPGSADSKQLRELYKGVNVGRGPRPVTAGGKVDAHILVKSLDSVEHTEEQLKAMRRIMQLCDPKPSSKLAAANCRALANAGGIPVLVRLLTCGATQLEWGAVLSLGSIAAFDNSTNAGSKHEIRQHGGLGQPPPLAHDPSLAGLRRSHRRPPLCVGRRLRGDALAPLARCAEAGGVRDREHGAQRLAGVRNAAAGDRPGGAKF